MKKILILISLFFTVSTSTSIAQDFNCLDCHENKIEKSVHESIIECQDCHSDVKDEEHIEKKPRTVNCGSCHEEYTGLVNADIHHRLKIKNPPNCKTCHGSHNVSTPPSDNWLKVKEVCSKCHTSAILANPYHAKAIGNKQCYACHKDVDTRITLPSSVHKNLQCADCHNYISHNINAHSKEIKSEQIADCYLCHTDIAKVHRESIHGISLKEGIYEAAKCWDCHGSHDIKKVNSPSSKVFPKNLAQTCGNCHDNPEIIKKYKIAIPNPGVRYSNSVHGKLVEGGRLEAANCILCHGAHDIKNKVQHGSKISTNNIPELCGKCHPKAAEEYQQSIHWIRAKKGFTESPVCDYCHSEHSIHAVNILGKREEAKKLQEETCMVCHENPRIAARFGKSGIEASRYQDSYHGMAVMRGDKDAAMCIDCHGVHKILPKDYSESSVSPENVTATCKKCHTNATQTFSRSYSHKTQQDEAAYVENIVDVIYFWFIIIVIGGMALHNALIFVYEIKKKKNKNIKHIKIPRFTQNEVIQHYLLLISFIVLAITGFALKYHQSWWANLLFNLGMTETARQYIHRGAAVVMMVTGVYHIGYLLFTSRGRDVLSNLLPKLSDFVEFRENMLYYLGISKQKPKFDKYDYTEKAEYWALIWGTIVMGITGLILWFPTLVGDWAPTWLIKVSELVHFYEAVLASLAIIIWHWFFVIFHPHEYPMSLTWIDGKMTLENYRHHHEKHFRKVVLQWIEYKSGKREFKKLSNSVILFTKTLEQNGLDPDKIINSEIEKDPELNDWIEKELAKEVEQN